MEGRPNLAGLLSGSPGSSLSSHHSTEGCQEPDRRNQGAQKDVRELPVILGALGALCHPSQHRRMSGTRQKEPGSTEGCQGAACHHWEPWELSVIPSQHRRMSGTRQKEPGSTEGCQREPASSLYYYIYVIRSAKYHSFIVSAIFHRFIVPAKYHWFFSQKQAKNIYFVKKHENFSRKTKIFPFFLASFKNSLYLCTVES